MPAGKRRHLRREDVAQHAVALFESQGVPVSGLGERPRAFPLHAAPRLPRLVANGDGAGAVAEQAGTDQYAAIVVDVKGCASYFYADRKHKSAALGGDQAFGGTQVRQRRSASLADQVQTQNVGPQADPLVHIAREAGA